MARLINSARIDELKLIMTAVEKKLAEKGALLPGRLFGEAALPEPHDGKHLSHEDLELATASFAKWREEAKNPMQSRSRGRIWLAFLLIRYGALRLGEVLELDDEMDISIERREVRIKGGKARSVLLPEEAMRRIDELLSSPMLFSLRGQVLRLDPGYLRRKFYERAKACGLPGSLFNPRVIRHSRAIELLLGGVPLQATQAFLGRQNLNLTANYLDFSEEAVNRIIKRYIKREGKMKTSARNSFTGKVSGIVRDGLLVEVELTTMSGLKVVSVITEESMNSLRLSEGSVATALIKAPMVILTKVEAGLKTSARNSFHGVISEIKSAVVASEVLVALPDGSKVCALITRESENKLELAAGMDILVMFKAFSVILSVE